jgi:hypothetical protein
MFRRRALIVSIVAASDRSAILARLMSLPGVLVLLVIVAAFGLLGAAVFWLALKDEHNRGRQD